MSFDYHAICARWISIWNELDEEARVAQAPEIWTLEASHFAPGFEGHGLKAIKERVQAAHNRFVKQAGCVIRSADYAGYGNALRILWEIAPAAGGTPIATGSEFLLLDDDGKARLDYQFNDPQKEKS